MAPTTTQAQRAELHKTIWRIALTEDHQAKILAFTARENGDYFTRLVPNSEIFANDFNITVSSYVAAEDTREATDIVALNAEIAA